MKTCTSKEFLPQIKPLMEHMTLEDISLRSGLHRNTVWSYLQEGREMSRKGYLCERIISSAKSILKERMAQYAELVN